jgi:hypothetical protein
MQSPDIFSLLMGILQPVLSERKKQGIQKSKEGLRFYEFLDA